MLNEEPIRELTEAEKISINYTLPELEDNIERAEMFLHRSVNNPAEHEIWRKRLADAIYMRNSHEDFGKRKHR